MRGKAVGRQFWLPDCCENGSNEPRTTPLRVVRGSPGRLPLELDSKLIDRALSGDRSAFAAIVDQAWAPVFLFIQQKISDRERARDLTQDTFLQAYDKRATVRREGSFVAWLFTIASRKVIDSYRRHAADPTQPVQDTVTLDSMTHGNSRSPGAALEQQEESLHVQEAVGRLDDLYRTVLILRYWSGMTPAQIARLLSEPEGTIRNRLFRAHARLKKLLQTTTKPESGPERAAPNRGGSPTSSPEPTATSGPLREDHP